MTVKRLNKTLPLLFLVACVGNLCAQKVESLSTEDKLNAAIKAYSAGNGEVSQSILEDIVKSNQANEVAYYYLGLIEHDKGKLDKAESLYRQAIAVNPQYARPYSDLSVILLGRDQLQEAEQMARKATAMDPSFVSGYINLAAVLDREKKHEEAYTTFVDAAKLNPDTVNNQGDQMLLQYNDPTAALYYYKIVLSVAPNHPFALLNGGQAYRMLGKPDQASALLKKAYLVIPITEEPFGVAYSSYFRNLFDNGHYEEIINTATDRVGTDYPSANLHLALSYFQLHKMDQFKQAAQKYFALSKKTAPASLEDWAREMSKVQQVRKKQPAQ